ncbi:MarR family winged helix-turn-helix transcriptional regulator [Pseudahrensia aquimaris]|uniref:MarR family winged helix-turn-helix transcriptional regulator n=1 Tax=Pseudahrensia aquimaris TaxID=744461 RepID=A0ABW3FC83_9HYPH
MKKISSNKIPDQLFVGNVLSAFTLAMTDKVNAAICKATGQSESACYAIVQIGTERNSSIEDLRRMLGLEHSSVVRLIDRLERSGFARRERGASSDKRRVIINLTDEGENQFTRILDARAKVIQKVIAQLSASEMELLNGLVAKLMPAVAECGDDQHVVCRLCDLEVCPQERCPVNLAYPENAEFPKNAFRRLKDSHFA